MSMHRERNAMSGKTIRYPVDPDNLPPLTTALRAELEMLMAMPDSEIDFSDIPPIPDARALHEDIRDQTKRAG